jgi:type II secretory pathway component GspD/PulD (secretin)
MTQSIYERHRQYTLHTGGRLRPSAVLAFYLFIFLCAICAPEPCRGEAAILRVMYRNASDVLPLVEGLLSHDGRAAVDTQSNSLVVVDSPESIRRVEAFLADLDRPGRQARVRLRFRETETTQGRSLSSGGSVSGDGWRVSSGRTAGQGVDVRVGDGSGERREKSEFSIQVTSGSSAYIAVGREVPYTQRWVDLNRRHAGVSETVGIRRIETGMDVRPTLMGDRADVEIVPRISHEAPGGRREVVRFAEVTSRLNVGLGQWVEIGGADTDQSEVMRAILETSGGSRQGSLIMMLMIEGAK